MFLLYPPKVTGCYVSLYYFICKLLKQKLAIRSTTIKLIIKSSSDTGLHSSVTVRKLNKQVRIRNKPKHWFIKAILRTNEKYTMYYLYLYTYELTCIRMKITKYSSVSHLLFPKQKCLGVYSHELTVKLLWAQVSTCK